MTERVDLGATPLVSIGVPVYNGEHHLSQALDAMLSQTYANFEIIISDNGSTDSTAKICLDYAARDSRVRYFRQLENVGLPRNWNFVAAQARGRYFKWASATDYVARSLLATCVALLESAPDAVLAFGRTSLVGTGNQVVEEYAGDFPLLADSATDRLRAIWDRMGLNNAVCGVIRLEALHSTGLIRPYPASDLVLMAELALQGKFLLATETLLFRRVEDGAMSSRLPPLDIMRLHNPATRGHEWVAARRHRDLLVAVLMTRGLPSIERCKALGVAMRRTIWAREALLAELTGSLRALALPKRLER